MLPVNRLLPLLALVCLLALGAGCAAKTPEGAAAGTVTAGAAVPADEFEDYGDEDVPVIADPLEPWNRFWFRFNDVFLLKMAKPVYTGYTKVTPEFMRGGLSNAWHNIQAPVRILNRILQGEFAQAWVELGRFMVNSTIGLGGLGRIAEQNRVLVPFEENGADFGHTLEVWGVGEGCYLVWPFVGPSTVRDSVGLVGDGAASPFFWGSSPIGPVKERYAYLANGALRFNDLNNTLSAYETLVGSAVEPYSAVRDAYVKSRRLRTIRARAAW